ncbi:MAG: hypothetical protein H6721_06405 [Sandaracinus sp.]|nr:hypothetical protein [Sandaracinus sp.]
MSSEKELACTNEVIDLTHESLKTEEVEPSLIAAKVVVGALGANPDLEKLTCASARVGEK